MLRGAGLVVHEVDGLLVKKSAGGEVKLDDGFVEVIDGAKLAGLGIVEPAAIVDDIEGGCLALFEPAVLHVNNLLGEFAGLARGIDPLLIGADGADGGIDIGGDGKLDLLELPDRFLLQAMGGRKVCAARYVAEGDGALEAEYPLRSLSAEGGADAAARAVGAQAVDADGRNEIDLGQKLVPEYLMRRSSISAC